MPRKRTIAFRILLLLGSTCAVLAAAEAVVRIIGRTDADGNFLLAGRIVGQRHPPASAVRQTLQKYLATDTARMIYDAATGWKPRPCSSSHKGMYVYDARGIRVSGPDRHNRHLSSLRAVGARQAGGPETGSPDGTEPIAQKQAGTLRIGLFGDSFTHGDDVPYEQTWGAQLESMLRKAGIEAEVINFGVSAYGMDQAYLRWRRLGKSYKPDVVLFGFQAENVNRNVNLLRAFYARGTGIPFSKPRFILSENGELRLINSPTLPLKEIPHVMANMPAWELSRYESFYDRARYQRRWWHASRLASLAVDVLSDTSQARSGRRFDPFQLDGEPARVTLALLEQFRREVRQCGSEFLIVHLPKQSDLLRLLQRRRLAYQQLLERIAEEHALIDPQPQLLAAARSESAETLIPRHYSRRGGQIVAEVVAGYLIRRTRSR